MATGSKIKDTVIRQGNGAPNIGGKDLEEGTFLICLRDKWLGLEKAACILSA